MSETRDKAVSIRHYWKLYFGDRLDKGSNCKWKNDVSVMLLTELVNINMQVIRHLGAINYFSVSHCNMGKICIAFTLNFSSSS